MASQQVTKAPVGDKIKNFEKILRYTLYESIFSFEYNCQNEKDIVYRTLFIAGSLATCQRDLLAQIKSMEINYFC